MDVAKLATREFHQLRDPKDLLAERISDDKGKIYQILGKGAAP